MYLPDSIYTSTSYGYW